jgi:hypothetical protein
MEEPNYTLFEATFDPNELKREMSKLEISHVSDDDGGEYVPKTAEEVSKEMNPYWKILNQADTLAGQASVDNALVHRNISYMIRPLIPGALETDWTIVEKTMRRNGETALFKVYFPPQRPLYVICGCSHVENLARISHQTKEKDVNVHSQRTAFVVFEAGTAAWFQKWGPLFLAHLTTELRDLYPVFTPVNYLPVLLLMSPFSWQIGYREEVQVINGKQVTIPWAKTMARNLMHASQAIQAHIAGNPTINLALAWMDMPILIKHQVRCCRLNKIVKEVNFLLDPNLPSCRSWRTTLTSTKNGNSTPMEVSSMTHLHLDLSYYGKGHGKDKNNHLSDRGSSLFLLSLWTGFGQGLRDRNAAQDYSQCRPVISTPPFLQTSYFSEVQDLRETVSSDTTSTESQMTLDALENWSIDVSSVNINLRYQQKPEFGSYMPNNQAPAATLSDRAHKRVMKNAIYDKVREIRNQKATGLQDAGRGPGKWR